MKKRIISAALLLCMLISLVPSGAFAEGEIALTEEQIQEQVFDESIFTVDAPANEPGIEITLPTEEADDPEEFSSEDEEFILDDVVIPDDVIDHEDDDEEGEEGSSEEDGEEPSEEDEDITEDSLCIISPKTELEVGETMHLDLNTSAEGSSVIWESSDEAVMTVDDFGIVAALSTGTAEITASVNTEEAESLSCSVALTVVEKTPDWAFPGQGTEAEPFGIGSEEALRQLAELVNSGDENYTGAYYLLTDNIALSGAWTPIGTALHPFAGHFNGDGRKITGLAADVGTGSFGLFGVTRGAVLTRLALEKVNIQVKGFDTAAAIVGYMQGGSLSESYANGSITNGSGITGGLIAVLDGGLVENCYNAAEVYGYEIAGGVVGRAVNGAAINCCYGSGYTMSENWVDKTGCIVGSLENSALNYSYAVQCADYYGLIVPEELAATPSSFDGFDFKNVWEISSGKPGLIRNVCDTVITEYNVTSASTLNAFLIGQENYNLNANLCGENDVTLMTSLLSTTATGWNIMYATDVYTSNITKFIKQCFANAVSSSTNLFYYSGHGVYGSLSNSSTGSITGVDDSTVTPSQLASAFAACKGHYYILIDSCGSGGLINKGVGDESDNFNEALINAFKELDSRVITKSTEFCNSKYSVLTASKGTETSSVIYVNTVRVSEFTYCLAKAGGINLSGTNIVSTSMYADSNSDSKVTFTEAYNYLKNNVDHSTPQIYPTNCTDVLFSRSNAPATTYTVSYDANGGSGAPSSQTKYEGITLTLSTVRPTRSGYEFLGWSSSSTATTPTYQPGGSYTANASTTLYAVWGSNDVWVTSPYNLESAHNYSANCDKKWHYTQSGAKRITLTFDSNTEVESNYDFIYIYDGNNNQVGKYTGTELAGQSVTINGSTVCIRLTSDSSVQKWGFRVSGFSYASTYTISYDANGGSGAPSSQTVSLDVSTTISSTKPTRAGYEFLGWAKSKSATSAQYQPGQTYSENTSVTLYAVWKKIPSVTSITLSPTTLSFYRSGQRRQLSISIAPSDASKSVTWSSSDTSVATVSTSGMVTSGSKIGSATITVKANDGSGKSAKCTVKVMQPVTGLEISSPQTAVLAGKSVQLSAVVSPSDAGDKTVNWSLECSSSLSPYLTINNGKLTVDKNTPASLMGTVNVVATATGAEASISKKFPIKLVANIESMTLKADGVVVASGAKGNLLIGEKESVKLSTAILPSQACQDVTWSSSKTSVAAVDTSGKVTAVSKGSATITATSCDGAKKTVKYNITVGYPVSSVAITKDRLYLAAGSSYTPKTTVLPSNAADKTLTWSISPQTDMVTVDAKGKVSVSKSWSGYPQSVTVTATANGSSLGRKDSITLEIVTSLAKSVTMYDDYGAVAKSGTAWVGGSSIHLNASVSPYGAPEKVIWSSSKESVATVDQNGNVTPIGKGSANITATAADGSKKSAKYSLTVKQPVTDIALQASADWICYGKKVTIKPTALPTTANTKSFTYELDSSSQSFATVSTSGSLSLKSDVIRPTNITVTVTTKDGCAPGPVRRSITVTAYPKATALTLNSSSSIYLSVGQSANVSYTLTPSNAMSIQWSSSSASVASVNSAGKITALKSGTATITGKTIDGSNKSIKIKVTVY